MYFSDMLLSSGMFVNLFWVSYFLSPRFCHKFVGYLEEEAVRTYTYCIEVSVVDVYAIMSTS